MCLLRANWCATGGVLATLVMLALAAAGCGGTDSPIEQLGDSSVDEETMERLLTLDDIARVDGETARLNREVEDVLAVAEAMNPGQTEGVVTWHAMKVRRGGTSAALIFTLQEFASTEDARRRFSQIVAGLGYQPMDTPVGESSALLTSAPGIGLSFIKGHRLVSLQTTAGEAEEPILDATGIEDLAQILESRL